MRKSNTKRLTALIIALVMIVSAVLTGCGGSGKTEQEESKKPEAPEIKGLTYESTLELKRATEFSVYHYEGGYDLIDIHDSQRFLLVPEGEKAPEGIDDDIIVLQKPIDRIYLAATAAMAMFVSMDALDHIRMSSIKPEAWTFDEPKEAMKKGDIIYAGK